MTERVPRYVLRERDTRSGNRPRVYELEGGPDVGSLDGVEFVMAEDFDRLVAFMRETLTVLEDMLHPKRRP